MTSDVLTNTLLTVDEQAVLQTELFSLLASLISEYTKGKSTSVPENLARELMESVMFNLRLFDEQRAKEIISKGVRECFESGVRLSQQKASLAGRLWKKVFFSRPDLFNHSMLRTLSEIKKFPALCDCRFFAHQIPCDIDYQLCIPVAQELKGSDYIIEYLRHLLIENEILNRFNPEKCKPVLYKYCNTWQTEVLNIFEPVAETAIILALIGGDIKGLSIEDKELMRICFLLSGGSCAGLSAALGTAARQVSKALEITSQPQKEYLARIATSMVPKLNYLTKYSC